MENKTTSAVRNLQKKVSELQYKNSELEKKLQKFEQSFNTLLDAIPDMVYLKDKNLKNRIVNKAFADFVGLKKEDIIGKKDEEFFDPDLAEQCRSSDEEVLKKRTLVSVDEESDDKAGEAVYFNTLKSPIFDDKGNINGLVGISRDLTIIKTKEAQIKKSLEEKEVLLKEIHHRVKNNMQIISSLLNLQAKNIQEEGIKQIFNQCRSRIKAMSLVHDKLYKSSSLEKINFSNYTKTLTMHLMSINNTSERSIKLHFDMDEICLDINESIPLGLITNELVSNSLKHAFPSQSLFNNINKEPKQISVSLKKKKGKNIELTVKDNGVGLPNNFEEKTENSLGMNLVMDLVEQIKGKLKIDSLNGACFKITFSL
ncbi:MAG: PAS domain-containing protein [Candidatus Aminicenantes bacterium]|nr:PAS domain-containing protein [Candidatus Aminicenantes bacterium]